MAVNKISGLATVSGGEYDELVVDGTITCNGSLKANTARVNGVVTINGKLIAQEDLRIDGVVTVNDEVQGKNIRVNGVSTINGGTAAKENILIDGTITVKEKVRGKEIRVGGVCTIQGNMEADQVFSKGVISCHGQISADLVEGRGVICAKEIVGEKVILHCETKRPRLFRSRELPRVDLIEATEIDIDGVKCQNVNGQNITIGPQCVVENVDCTGTLRIAPGAKVSHINGQPR